MKKFLNWLRSLFGCNRPKPTDLGTFDQYVPYTRGIDNEIWSYDPVTLKIKSWTSRNLITPTSATSGDVAWLDKNNQGSNEEWSTKFNCGMGQDWVWLSAYRDNQSGARYAIRTLKATYQDVKTGTVTDISQACLPDDGAPHGQPYALVKVTPDPYIIRAWMQIWAANGVPDKLVYWEARFQGGLEVHNPCWSGIDATRLVVNQQECWWEQPPGSIPNHTPGDQGSWIHGGGTVPFDSTGNPVVPEVWYGTDNNFGKDVGAGWKLTNFDQPGHAFFWAGVKNSKA